MALTPASAQIGSAVIGGIFGNTGSQTTTASSQKKKYLDLSPEGYNKIIQDILASDAGLASLATGENLSGGYGSSVKAQLGQDLVLNIAGEMAKLTAPTIEEGQSKSKTKKKMSVICTELQRQGLLDTELYEAGHAHFLSLPVQTVAGYRIWANKVVPILQKYPAIARAIAPLVTSRYEYIVHNRFSVFGWFSVAIAQPICYVIGSIVLRIKGNHGDLSATA